MVMSTFRHTIERWKANTPKFFKNIIYIAIIISTSAIGIQTTLLSTNSVIPHWWEEVYPYLIGIGAGMSSVAKLTREYDHEGDGGNVG